MWNSIRNRYRGNIRKVTTWSKDFQILLLPMPNQYWWEKGKEK